MAEKTPKTRTKTTSGSKKSEPKMINVEAAASAEASARTPEKKVRAIPAEDRYRLIAETAYFIAERRGFSNGRCEEDWYEAERLVTSSQEQDSSGSFSH